MTQLTRLHDLTLKGMGASESVGGLEPIPELRSLRVLVLQGYSQGGQALAVLPDDLPSGIEQLHIVPLNGTQGSWNATLECVPLLTGLRLGLDQPTNLEDPYLTSLDGLSRLQWLHIAPGHSAGTSGFEAYLPAGVWPSRLRRLALTYEIAERDLHVLQAATRLEQLHLLTPPAARPDAAWATFLEWASTHPPLRSITYLPYWSMIDPYSRRGQDYLLPATAEAVAALVAARPTLRVRCQPWSDLKDLPGYETVLPGYDYSWPVQELQAMAPAPDD